MPYRVRTVELRVIHCEDLDENLPFYKYTILYYWGIN